MTMRITQRMLTQHSVASLQLGLTKLARSQEQLSTGRTINRPSDSPTGTNDAMRLRATAAASTQYARNAQDGEAWLNSADSTLGSMMDQVRRARDLMLQGASTGSVGQSARDALAQEVTQIRQGLITEANTSMLGRPIFGGTTAGSVAYDASGAYVGDGNEVVRTVGEGVTVGVSVTGPAAFSAGGDDLFTVLGDVIDQLRTNPAALGSSLDRLDAVTGSMRAAQAEVGSRTNRVTTSADHLADALLDTRNRLSEIENVDIAAAIVDVQMQEVAYQASLGATARVIQPSLVDFLR